MPLASRGTPKGTCVKPRSRWERPQDPRPFSETTEGECSEIRSHIQSAEAWRSQMVSAPTMAEGSPFQEWLDRFFEAYYDGRPVNATFIGVHDRDHLLPDFSESGAGDVLSGMETLLREAEALDAARASDAASISGSPGALRIQIWEYRSGHFHQATRASTPGRPSSA